MKAVNCVGRRFSRLTVVERIPKGGDVKHTTYRCRCDCGTEVLVLYGNLQNGNTHSCGCFRLEVLHRRKQDDAIIRLNEMWRYYRRNAKLREVVWGLSKELFQSLVHQPCTYCDYHDDLCGIDRVDNSKGYSSENSVPCCRWCNWGKNERTLEEFNDWVRRLYAKQALHRR